VLLTPPVRPREWKSPSFDGLPSRGSRVRLIVDGIELCGHVHGYSLSLSSTGTYLWLDEEPGLLTRIRVDAIEDWGHVG
jgi:hypothetical protein